MFLRYDIIEHHKLRGSAFACLTAYLKSVLNHSKLFGRGISQVFEAPCLFEGFKQFRVWGSGLNF